MRSARVEARGISVTTDAEGMVHLTGHVRSLTEGRQAEQAAWSSDGVSTVVNDLHVKY